MTPLRAVKIIALLAAAVGFLSVGMRKTAEKRPGAVVDAFLAIFAAILFAAFGIFLGVRG